LLPIGPKDGVFEVVQSVVDVGDVGGAVGKGQPLEVGRDRHDLDADADRSVPGNTPNSVDLAIVNARVVAEYTGLSDLTPPVCD
jgi:hypothetical protein